MRCGFGRALWTMCWGGAVALFLQSCFLGDEQLPTDTDVGLPSSQLDLSAESYEITPGVFVTAERAQDILANTARELALALGRDATLRGRVYEAMRNSSFAEGKLDFRADLEDPSSGLLATMANAGSRSEEAIRSSLDSLMTLALYMPVDEHRGSWAGGSDLLVAAQLGDDPRHPLRGFDLSGRTMLLDKAMAPTTPTLVLVPAEMDFDAERQRAARGNGPARTSYEDGEGFYMTSAHIVDLEESWPFGDPELAVHVAVKNENNDEMEFKSCAGDNYSSSSAYYYDQNDHYWTGPPVKLAAEATVVGKDIEFLVLEDDYNRCDGSNNLKPHSTQGIIGELVNVYNAVAKLIGLDTLSGHWETIQAGYGLGKAAYEFATAVTNDDVIGLVKRLTYGCYYKATGPIAYGLVDKDGQDVGGWVAIDNTDEAERVLCQPAPPSPIEVAIVGPTEIPPTGAEECAWSAYIENGGGGTLTYLWEWNDEPVGFESIYVPNGPAEGSYWLKLTVANEIYSDWDGIMVDVDDQHSCF